MKSTLKTLATLATGSIAAVTFGGMAQAVTLNANLGFAPSLTAPTFVGSTLGSATSITFGANNAINVIDPTYRGLTNDFFPGQGAGIIVANPAVTFNSLFLDLSDGDPGLPLSISFATSAGTATFTGGSFTRASANPNSLTLLYTGDITGLSPTFDSSPASLTFSFNTTGGGIANYSATLASPPVTQSTPEPATLLGLVTIAGLAGMSSLKKVRK